MVSATDLPESDERRVSFTGMFRLRSFAVLYTAETASIIGDQLARIALSVLVFNRTGNAAASALTYATTFLPAIAGGFMVAGLGDRLPRRVVLVGCDVLRAALFALMAIPDVPIWLLLVILVVAVFMEPAFAASEVSYLADELDGEQYRAATALRTVTNQAAQVAGFAVGGVIVALIAPRGALLIDAGTFLVSALLIAALLPPQASSTETGQARVGRRRPLPGFWRVGELRYLVPLSALAAFFVAPEGLAVPFGRAIGASTAQTGLLLAAMPLGGAVGAALLVKVVPAGRRMPTALLMTIMCGLPLLVSAFMPSWPVALVFWFASGVFAAYQVEINSAVVEQIPEQVRAKWVGVFGASLLGAQGVGIALFGLIAQWWSPGASIATAGLVGTAGALALCRLWSKNKRGSARLHERTGAATRAVLSHAQTDQ